MTAELPDILEIVRGITKALDAFWLLDLAIEETDPERIAGTLTMLDNALYALADAAGLRHYAEQTL